MEGDRFTESVLVGNGDVDFVARFEEFLTDDLLGESGMVAFLGEVGKMDMFEVGMNDFGEELSALVIGEMALSTENTLFVNGRAAGGMDHGGLVIGFDVEVITLFEMIFDKGGGKTKVSTKAYFKRACVEGEGDGIEGIVLDTEGVDFNVTELEGLSGGKNFEAGDLSEDLDDGFRSVTVGKDGNFIFASECDKAFNVIGVFMSD